jgi:CubicO group peptidase (beta-lactamase class C family)
MTRKKVLYGILIFFLLVITGGVVFLSTLLPIITGYAAKNLCSAVFVSGRAPIEVESMDLNFSFIKYTHNKVDIEEKSVRSRFLWGRSKAIYRDGFGVTLLRDVREKELRKTKFPDLPEPGYRQDTIAWPMGDLLPDSADNGIDRDALNTIASRIITDNGYGGNAFAFMVMHKGMPVAEAYKPQFNKDTRFLSWSMAKSFTNALVGILVREGKMDISKPAGVAAWKDDERSRITLNDLMQMQSGLEWNEDYGSRSDVNVMLHCKGDMDRFAFDKRLEYPAGIHWHYSSGTSNIISYLIREQFDTDSAYYAFAYEKLFDRIGIDDAVFEVDPEGRFVGSSYLYATARDYARFALLFQNDGVFNGERILPGGWVKYSRTPASASKGEYGALFWLNECIELPSAPANMYMCVGHDGQRIFILPDEELIVVVLGYSPTSRGGMDFDGLLKDIKGAL